MWLDYTVGCDAEGRLTAVRARIIGRHGRLRVRRRQGARARGRARLRPLRRAARRRRVDSGLHEQPAVRRDARLRRQPDELRDRGAARHARGRGRHRRLGDALAQRARYGRPLRDGPEARARRGAEEDAARREGRLPGSALRGDRLLCEEHRHRQRRTRPGTRRAPRRGGRERLALPLLDRDGTGRAHRAPPDACETLDLAPERIRVYVDTERELDTGQTTASRATVLGGRAVLAAPRS